MTERAPVNILLVDDRPENLLVLKATLAPLGERLVDVRSGKEALKHLLEEEFAVILLDVMMPDMDGFETARIIREREKSRHTPIIFVTAMLRDDADAFKGYAVGAVDYIMKPFQPEILRSKVSVFVDLFRKGEEIKRQAEVIRQNEQRELLAKLTEAERLTELERERVQSERNAIHSILQHAPMGIARLNSQQIITDMNDVFAKQFGLQKDHPVGKNIFDLIGWLAESLQEAVEADHPCHIPQQRILVGSEETNIYCDISTWPISDIHGKNVGTIFLARDVTERVQLDMQRKDFVATLAHDLQTPVIASDRALSLIMGKVTDSVAPETFKLVTMLKKNNENLLHMIESLLDVYHYEAGAQALYFDNVDLKLLATNCVDEVRLLAHEQGLTVHTTMPDDLPAVLADRTAMRRVITNLLDNAIKFTPYGGMIDVRGYSSDGQVIVEIEDTGIGIPPGDQAHLFERFWHGIGHKAFKTSNGLGLFLCKQIIDSHHGRIECESEVGKMTMFRITLPVSLNFRITQPSGGQPLISKARKAK